MLQANLEAFWNALVETRKKIVEIKKGFGTNLVPPQKVSKRSAVGSHKPLEHEIKNPIVLFLFNLMIFKITLQLWKNLCFFVHNIIYCGGAGNSNSMSLSEGLGPYVVRRKMEKTRPMRKEMCLFQESEFSFCS